MCQWCYWQPFPERADAQPAEAPKAEGFVAEPVAAEPVAPVAEGTAE